jgi:probable phosphoglycerate mutase
MSAPLPAEIPLFMRMFYFLRHGETESNRQKTIAGSLDVELNETGRAQAQAAIELVRPLGVTHVTSSALRRARDTAAVIAGALELPHAVVPDLAERGWGDLEGKPQALRAAGVKAAGAESREQFIARTRAGLTKVGAGGTPLVVAHSGTFRVLCRLLELAEPGEAVANCRPVRFTPPARAGEGWSMAIVQE